MVLALQQAGAERGLLILSRGEDLRIEAEATTAAGRVTVRGRRDHATERDLPESIVRDVEPARQTVLLDDAAAEHPFPADPYLRERHARSILCMPLMSEAALIGLLYLENSLAARVFTAARVESLTLLASQVAIALENARRHSELREAEQKLHRHEADLRQTIENLPVMIWTAQADGVLDFVNQRWIDFGGGTWSGDGGDRRWLASVHPDDALLVEQRWTEAVASGAPYELELRVRGGD